MTAPRRESHRSSVAPCCKFTLPRGGTGCGRNVRIMRLGARGAARKLVALPDLADVGYMYAYERQDGTTTLFFNRSRCKDRADYRPHPWDVYKIEGANAS